MSRPLIASSQDQARNPTPAWLTVLVMGLLLGDVGLAFRARQLWTQAYDDFTEIRIPRRTMEQRLDVLVGVTMTGITRIPQPERPRVLFILHEAALDPGTPIVGLLV